MNGARCLIAATWLAGAALLVGCAHGLPEQSLRVGISQRADVIASQGQPRHVWPEADGGSTLEYTTQPFGTSCYMFRLNARGELVEFHDALLPRTRNQVAVGMTPEQVVRLLGHERRRESYAFSGEDVWDWTVEPDGLGDGLRFNVHFKDGLVVRTSQSLVLRSKGERRQ